MPRDSAAADRPASYLVGTAAAFPLFFRDRTKPINQLPFSPSAKFPKSGSSCESRVNIGTTGSCVPYRSPSQGHAAFMPDAGWAVGRLPPTLARGTEVQIPVSTWKGYVTTRPHRIQ